MFPEVFANSWRAISEKLGLMVAQLDKKFIFLRVTGTWTSVFRKALLSIRRTERTPPTLFLCVTF